MAGDGPFDKKPIEIRTCHLCGSPIAIFDYPVVMNDPNHICEGFEHPHCAPVNGVCRKCKSETCNKSSEFIRPNHDNNSGFVGGFVNLSDLLHDVLPPIDEFGATDGCNCDACKLKREILGEEEKG